MVVVWDEVIAVVASLSLFALLGMSNREGYSLMK